MSETLSESLKSSAFKFVSKSKLPEISIFRTIAKQQPGQKLNETGYQMILKNQKNIRKISSYINF